jgi:hypothetical protein
MPRPEPKPRPTTLTGLGSGYSTKELASQLLANYSEPMNIYVLLGLSAKLLTQSAVYQTRKNTLLARTNIFLLKIMQSLLEKCFQLHGN